MTFDGMDRRTTTSIEQEAAMLSKFRAIWTETKETVSKFQQLQTRYQQVSVRRSFGIDDYVPVTTQDWQLNRFQPEASAPSQIQVR
jgi:hypothetical protein